MNKSSTIGSLAQALSKAQAEIKPAAFNAVNPFLKNRYADLGSIIEAARPVMTKYGLSFTQLVGGGTDTVEVETVLMHESGEFIGSTMSLPLVEERGKSGAQVAGSVITYLRRYSLAAIIGIYADEDTDGNDPSQQATKVDPRQAQQVKRQPEPEYDEPVQNPSVIERLDAKANGVKKAGPRPYSPETLVGVLTGKAGKHMGETMSDGARGLLVGKLDELFDGNTSDRHRFTKYVTGYGSTKNMPVNFMKALEDWVTYDPAMAQREAKSVIAMLDGEASAPLFTESEK